MCHLLRVLVILVGQWAQVGQLHPTYEQSHIFMVNKCSHSTARCCKDIAVPHLL